MSLKPTKTDVRKILPVLDGEYDSVEEAGEAVLLAAWAQYEKKAKFMVLGQVLWPDAFEDQADIDDSRVALGPFATRKQAEGAGESLAISSSAKAEARWLIAEFWPGTPASYYTEKVKAFKERMKDSLTPAEELSARLRERLLAVDDLKAGRQDPWTITDDGEVVLDADAARLRLDRAQAELDRALADGRPPLLSPSETEAIRDLLRASQAPLLVVQAA